MLVLLPKAVPSLALLLADLGQPSAAAVAVALDVTPRTVERWIIADTAPRTALLALFWLTRWGQSQVDCRAVNDARLQAQIAASLQVENARLCVELARLCALGDFGCSNDPVIVSAQDTIRLKRMS